jgi:hypothetical protein
MKLSEIERIAKAAMNGCLAVINHPNDSFVRERMFNSLAEVVDPAFFGTDQSRRGTLNHLLRQANVWGAIVRNRIEIFRHAGPSNTSGPSIQHPTRDLSGRDMLEEAQATTEPSTGPAWWSHRVIQDEVKPGHRGGLTSGPKPLRWVTASAPPKSEGPPRKLTNPDGPLTCRYIRGQVVGAQSREKRAPAQ